MENNFSVDFTQRYDLFLGIANFLMFFMVLMLLKDVLRLEYGGL